MPTFVHLTPEKYVHNILRNGIKRGERGRIYAMPVVPCFFRTHQWLRELKRGLGTNGFRTMTAVYFRIADSTPVWVGHYGREHVQVTADTALARLMQAQTPLGFEVYLARSIERKEIKPVRAISQVVGWRYSPEAHGRKPCSCDYCTFGAPGGRRLRERAEEEARPRQAQPAR